MRLSTGLGEGSQLLNIHYSLSEYIDLMVRMNHTRLNANAVIRHATVIHNYHNPVVQVQSAAEDLYNDSLQILMEASGMDEHTILPEDSEDLNTYIDSINRLFEEDEDINYEDVTRHATNVYNYHRSTQPIIADVDHPF